MAVEWMECKLGDIVTLKRGYDLPQASRQEGSVPVVSSSGITGFHSEARAKAPGVVTGRYGTLGEVFYIERDFWPLNTTLYVRDFKGNDPRYISYLLKTLDFALQNVAGAVPGVNRNYLHLLSVRVPPLPTQRKIAAILSAYDDLIEVNTRRIALLEQMAQALYREWFVHYRFPGHQDVPLVDSPLGPIPEGWEAKQLEDACDLVIGQSPKSEFYNEEGRGLPFHQGVKDFSDLFPTTRIYCTDTRRIAELGDILFSVRAPVGRMNIADRRIVVGRGLHAIRSKTRNQSFVFWQLKDKFYEEDIMGGGTIFKAVTKADMLGLELLIPPTEAIVRFEQIANPILSALKVFTAKNINLRRTRDLLLPRLISGQLDVSHLPIGTDTLEDSARSRS